MIFFIFLHTDVKLYVNLVELTHILPPNGRHKCMCNMFLID